MQAHEAGAAGVSVAVSPRVHQCQTDYVRVPRALHGALPPAQLAALVALADHSRRVDAPSVHPGWDLWAVRAGIPRTTLRRAVAELVGLGALLCLVQSGGGRALGKRRSGEASTWTVTARGWRLAVGCPDEGDQVALRQAAQRRASARREAERLRRLARAAATSQDAPGAPQDAPVAHTSGLSHQCETAEKATPSSGAVFLTDTCQRGTRLDAPDGATSPPLPPLGGARERRARRASRRTERQPDQRPLRERLQDSLAQRWPDEVAALAAQDACRGHVRHPQAYAERAAQRAVLRLVGQGLAEWGQRLRAAELQARALAEDPLDQLHDERAREAARRAAARHAAELARESPPVRGAQDVLRLLQGGRP